MFSFAYNSSSFSAADQGQAPPNRAALVQNLGYASNNRYPDFPPFMSDGRSVISSWNTESQWNQDIAQKHHLTSNWKYRKYLTKNADTIRENQYFASCNDTGSFLPKDYSSESVQENSVAQDSMMSIPFLYTSYTSTKTYAAAAPPSDLKDIYLTREQLFARKFTPSMQK